jgi:hypothetical protein
VRFESKFVSKQLLYNKPMKRTCSICGNIRQEDEFYWRNKSRDIRMRYCRYCQHEFSRQHYQVNKSRYFERNERRRLKHVELISKAKSLPCADCKREYPFYVMEFDHVRGEKRENLARMATLGLSAILKEIDKCDVVCSNCHKERTWRRNHAPVA